LQGPASFPENQVSVTGSVLFMIGTWLALTCAFPVRTGGYDFRHISVDEGLTLTISRNSPPMAAINDERLPIVPTEPALDLTPGPDTKIIGAGQPAWPHLKKFSQYFERKYLKLKAPKKYARHPAKKPFSKDTYTHKAKNSVSSQRLAKLTKMSDLTSLMKLLPKPKEINESRWALAEKAKPRTLAAAGINVEKRADVRTRVEAPLTAPTVRRSLPREEERQPTVIEEDRLPALPQREEPQEVGRLIDDLPLVISKSEESVQPRVAAAPSEIQFAPREEAAAEVRRAPAGGLITSRGSARAAKEPPRTNVGITAAASSAPPQLPGRVAQEEPKQPDTSREALIDESVGKFDVAGFDGGGTVYPFQISGQVELAGGLAVTGYSTKLNIQWKTGSLKRDALVDYSTGKFLVDVPTLEGGKLFATLVDDSGSVLGQGDFDLNGLTQNSEKTLEGVKILIEPKESLIKGRIYSAYSYGDVVIPVKNGELFAPGSTRELADNKGFYRMSGLSGDSTFILDAYAPDHWGTRVIAEGTGKPQIPAFSNKMLESFLDLVGQSANNTELGIIWGEVKHRGKPKAGVKVTLSTTNMVGPIYFNALRLPDLKQKETSDNGLFAFIKVKPGLHVVMAQFQNRELPSSVVSVGAGLVSHVPLALKKTRLKGRVFDPMAQKYIGATVSVVGSSRIGQASPAGFEMEIPSSDSILFVEANAGKEYVVSREAVPRSGSKNIELYAFKRAWLDEQLHVAGVKQADGKGILIGFIKGPEFHVTLESESDPKYSEQNVFYFDSEGKVEPGRLEGVAGGGAFMMTNLKPGLHTLIVSSPGGEITTSRIVVSEAGVVNVLSMPLRP
jgi:hypothetical protein